MSDTTLVVTSCRRMDLLQRTLESFDRCNTYPISPENRIIIEDSGDPAVWNDPIWDNYRDWTLIFNDPKKGHLASIDHAYSLVKTPFIFHCEEDWEFHGSGFIEQSKEILSVDPKMMQVWIRDHDDSGHKVHPEVIKTKDGLSYFKMTIAGWGGFSWNPGLRRSEDWKTLGGYVPFRTERGVSDSYKEQGFYASHTYDGYCRHIGWHRHVSDPFQGN